MANRSKDLAAAPNKHGCPSPAGCSSSLGPRDKRDPLVAVGLNHGSFENALLVLHNSLMEVIFAIILQSTTLKAWLALLRSEHSERSSSPEMPSWNTVWQLISDQRAAWEVRYNGNEVDASEWEIRQPRSKLELYALTLFVVFCNVHDNPNDDTERIPGLKWHEYYYEDEGRFYLLHRLFVYLKRESRTALRALCLTPPRDSVKRRTWKRPKGSQVCSALDQFMNDSDWDPKNLVGYMEADSSALALEQEEAVITKKAVLIVDDDEEITCNSSSNPREDDNNLGPNEILRVFLQWSKRMTITSIFPRDVGEVVAAITTLDELWKHISSAEGPRFSLHASVVRQGPDHRQTVKQPDHRQIIKQPDRQDFSKHWVLKLEAVVGALGPTNAPKARPMFALIRQNHRHSHEYVAELQNWFTPVIRIASDKCRDLSALKELCQTVIARPAQASDFRAWLGVLEPARRTQVQQCFELLDKGNPAFEQLVPWLVKQFMPSDVELEMFSKMKDLFEEVARDADGA